MTDESAGNNIPQNNEESAELGNTESLTGKALARRQLLKILVATGAGVTAAAFIPEKWVKPVMKGGVLPVHAQTSPAPTATALPIYAITTCNAQNASGGNTITPFDTISTFAIITPADAGIQLRRRIILNQTGHPQDGQDLNNVTGTTDGSGQFTPADFDLSTVSGLTAGVERIAVRWEFVDAADGANVCVNLLTLVNPPN